MWTRAFRLGMRFVVVAAAALPLLSCASSGAGAGTATATGAPSGSPQTAGAAGRGRPPIEVASSTTASLAGPRCQGTSCSCRPFGREEGEPPSPPAGHKRFEIRVSAAGGKASLRIGDLGTVVGAGDHDTCYYVDLPAGSTHELLFVAAESAKGVGVGPRFKITEYGPAADSWYDILTASCRNAQDRCDQQSADAWGQSIKQQRKRGRMDPCGSSVVTALRWETTGGEAIREGGLFEDFILRFNMEVKKFETKFAPGSPECVPK